MNKFQKFKNGSDRIKQYATQSKEAKQKMPLSVIMIHDSLAVLVTIAYILLGSLGGWWHPAWLIFLLIPTYYMMESTIIHRSPEMVPVAFLAVGIYLSLGFIGGLWHPYWAILLIIPVYYMTLAAIKGANWSKIFNVLVPFVAVAIFLVLGFVLNAWHPGWVVFFMIPLYYIYQGSVRKYKKLRGKDKDDDPYDHDVM